MPDIHLPHNWKPRWYQEELWRYMTDGRVEAHRSDNKHAEVVAHRRWGKDDVCLHFAATEMILVPATYWHMLPQANQVRKAIWEAINPHTGIRRIDEAFPRELFDRRESDMLVRCKVNGATWQCLGSDNYDTAVGSPPRGITYSEWALANPSVRGYLRPIIAENRGWQLFIGTPRGKNHAYQTYRAAKSNPNQLAIHQSIHYTAALSATQLMEELIEFVSTYGEAQGIALYEQEYECSFEAALIGAYYGQEIRKLRAEGRLTDVPHDPLYPVHVAFDIGYDDDTAIWWFQVVGNEIRILEYYYNSGKDVDHYCSQLLGKYVAISLTSNRIRHSVSRTVPGLEHRQEYDYGTVWLPHDAKAKTFAAKGKSVHEQFAAVFGWGKVKIVPSLSVQDGIVASRKVLNRCYVDRKCDQALEILSQYQREWDDAKKMFKDKPKHDHTSHCADAFRYLSIAWSSQSIPDDKEPMRWEMDKTFNEMIELVKKRNRDEQFS